MCGCTASLDYDSAHRHEWQVSVPWPCPWSAEKQNSFRACSAEQVVATHNNSLAMAKGGAINTILEMDWPSSDEDDEDFEDDSDADNAEAAPGDTDAAAAGADEGPRKKSRRVCMLSFCSSLCMTECEG